MSKKHFIALADTIRDINTHEFWGLTESEAKGKDIAIATVIEKLAEFCKLQNPAFDRERWFNYIRGECGPNGGSRK